MRRLRDSTSLATLAVTVAMAMAFTTMSTPSYAKKTALTPAKVKQATHQSKSYENCRHEAIAQLKQKDANKKKFEASLTACKENFPGASLYINCKKAAVRTAKTSGMPEADAADQCKRYLTATAFDPTVPLPFFVEAGQLYFAGIGMNRPQPATSLAPPNFDCTRLQKVMQKPKSAEYILFGNHPRIFGTLSEMRGSQLLKALQLRKPSKSGITTPGFGRVFGDPRKASGVTYFPSAPCDFEGDPGAIMTGLTSYYLIDQTSSSVTPYFGIAYYRADQTAITTTKLLHDTSTMLGPDFKSISKNKRVTFIAQGSLSQRDDEQDPKNLCRRPRNQQFVAVVQTHKNQPQKPEYLIIANIKNLCDFGDRLSKRLTD